MRKSFILSMSLVLGFACLQAQETYRLDAVSSAYTTPESGKLIVKTKDNLPRMADLQTKFVLRFDPFFFAAENEDVTSENIISAEVVIVSVLEGGSAKGTSRRVNDAEVMVYECDNSWVFNAEQPSNPFEIGDAIAGPILYEGIGANDFTQEFLEDYEEPTRIDITEFFKKKFEEGNEFSIDFIKSSEYTAEFTRMGGHGQAEEKRRPRIEITYGTNSSLSLLNRDEVNIWSENGLLFASLKDDYQGNIPYEIVSIVGGTVEKGIINSTSQQLSKASLTAGIYIVSINIDGKTINQKIAVK